MLAATAFPALAAKDDVVFSETFDTQEAFDAWTNIDVNGGRAWEYLRGTAAYMLDYQTSLPGDDWLISAAIDLKADCAYDLCFYAGSLTRVESLKVYVGTAPTVEGMTTMLYDEPSFTNDKNGDRKLRVTVAADGKYYIGFYAYSAPNQHRLEIDNVKVVEAGSILAPSAVEGLTVTRGERGAMTATIAATAPSTSLGSSALTANLTAVYVYRNSDTTPIYTFTDVAPGAALSWVDTEVAEEGWNTYRLVCANDAGEGDAAEASDFIGNDYPNAVGDLLAKLNSDKSITVTWTAPTESVEGGYVDFSGIVYRVVRSDSTVVDEAMTATTFTDARPITEGQGAVTYDITAVSPAGKESATATTNAITTGTPLDLPYVESFANTRWTSTPWTQDGEKKDFGWSLTFDDEEGEVEEVTSQDGDNGMLMAELRYQSGAESRLVSPMIDLSSAFNPVLTFWFYQAQSAWYDPEWDGAINDHLKVQISHNGGSWTDLDNATFYSCRTPTGWIECQVALPKAEGDDFVNIGFLAVAENDGSNYRCIYIDNITVDESELGKDLAVESVSASAKRVGVGEEIVMTATVVNRGRESAEGFSVQWHRDGATVATETAETLAPGEKSQFTYTYKAQQQDGYDEKMLFNAVVDYTDELAANNVSDTLSLSVRLPEVIAVSDLDGTYTDGSVTLTWSALQSYPEPQHSYMDWVRDDFESYEPFIIDGIGDWTVYDGDKASTLATPRIPAAYPHKGEPMAWQVFNVEDAGVVTDDSYDTAFLPYLGKQYLICPSADYPAENDDWLITPRLDGREQSISFRAVSASFDSEWLKVYYSTTDRHPDSFIPLNNDEVVYVNSWWTHEYKFDVPEGARYFAIRCVRRTVMLFVDEFIYAQHDGQPDAADFIGYNVYRNGVKVNAEPLAEPTFTESAEEGTVYTVTGVYSQGESAYSNEYVASASSSVSGIDASDVNVYAGKGEIIIAGNCSYEIFNMQGIRLAAGTCDGEVRESADNGVYVIRTDEGIFKVALR